MERDFKGIWISKYIWLRKDLNIIEKGLLAEIDSFDIGEGCSATNKYFADFFGVSATWISKLISRLKKKNYITIEMKYKKGTKELEERILRIVPVSTDISMLYNCNSIDIEQEDNTLLNDSSIGVEQEFKGALNDSANPIEQQFKDIIKEEDINNIYNNNLNNIDLINNNINNNQLDKINNIELNNKLINNNINNNIYNKDLQKIVKFYEENINFLSPTIYYEIQSYLEDRLEADLIIRALKEAVDRNCRNWKYANGILSNCKSNNIKTLHDFEIGQEQFKNKNNKTKPKKVIDTSQFKEVEISEEDYTRKLKEAVKKRQRGGVNV